MRCMLHKPLQFIYMLMIFICLIGGKIYADDRVQLDQDRLKQLIEKNESEFPMAVNQPVMKRLKFLLQRPEQVVGVKVDLERMEKYQKLVESQLKKHDLPSELKAIPFVETGYQNLPPKKSGTGLWMFTKDTAIAYQLEVSEKRDERMHPTKATEAAIQVLKDYYERFDDWLLALAAYNQGPTKVARVIKKTGVRDVWQLMEQGHLNNYPAKVIAAAIIINHHEQLLTSG
ncbi:MAG: lytic transglycosylase domain-containing protein [Oligoflexus sp.]